MASVDTMQDAPPRMPAEWDRHEATWLSWPHNPLTWPGMLAAAEAAMVDVVAALAPHERVHINVLDQSHAVHVRALLSARASPAQVTLHVIPTDDAWIRDHGAIFAFAGDGTRVALDFRFNAWGGKYPPWDRDQRVAGAMARELNVPTRQYDFVLEGGSIDVNGCGALLTTEQCLLNENRNPSMSRAQIQAQLAASLGVEEIVWLGSGIAGDDTDGHIDDITRFVSATTVVSAVDRHRDSPNHEPLAQNLRRLREARLAGGPIEVVPLPMPAPVFAHGEPLPASYANFYIANDVVLLPVFDDPADAAAIDVLGGCFPERAIVPIDARALVHGLGGIHCLTQQVPAVR